MLAAYQHCGRAMVQTTLILGWMDYPIDIGSIMTASVAMGIAVYDTLHFLTFFRRRLDVLKLRSS